MNNCKRIILATDLDRTLLPNGKQQESPQARSLFTALVQEPDITTVYVTGRHKDLILDAIETWHIPVPDYAVGDVGTTIYQVKKKWKPWLKWQHEIARDWNGMFSSQLSMMLHNLKGLQLQETEKLNPYKLSYYVDTRYDHQLLLTKIQAILSHEHLRSSIIYSVDEQKNRGLIDVLPERATKLHAILFLLKEKNLPRAGTVYAGDSGNDLPVFTSDLKSIVVKNARREVVNQAMQALEKSKLEKTFYKAKGNFMGLNGNYAAGIIEGLVHYFPEKKAWLEKSK